MKKLKAQKGITLIALIITIIILLILAVVVIGNLQDRDLLKYAQNAADDYNKEKDKEESVISGYEILIEESIEDKKEDGIIHKGTIPEGGTYTVADGTVYSAGQDFPSIVTAGDVYTFGDYEYKYNYIWNSEKWKDDITVIEAANEGWGVRVQDTTKTEYGPIITSINGKDVTNMVYTFGLSSQMVIPPAIPSGVTTIYSAFIGCTSLTTMPDMSKATSLVDVGEAFSSCKALKNITVIPNSVTDMEYTFSGCTALEVAPTIPEKVTNMASTFYNCTALKVTPIIPASVEDMRSTFNKCTALETALGIPASVTNMSNTFKECKALTGEIEINANPTGYDGCFGRTEKEIVIIGSATEETKAKLAGTGANVTWR